MRRNLTTSQLFSRFLTFCHLFSTTLISVHLILTLLNSQLSTLLSSYWLISPQFHSSNIFLSPVEVTQVQTCSIAFPFVRSVWFVQVAFVLWHRGVFTQRSFYTENLFCTEQVFTQRNFYTEQTFPLGSFYTEQTFTQRSFSTEKLLHRQSATQDAPK